MAPRRKVKNRHLPERVYFKHSAYYFVNKQSQWIRLGKSLHEAMAEWSKIIEKPKSIVTMNELFDRYMHEVAPKKAKRSYENNIQQIKPLRQVFGNTKPSSIRAVHIYKYLDQRGTSAPVAANREKELLSHIFTTAIRWGIVENNPCKDVRGHSEKGRDRYIENWEFTAVKNIASPLFKSLMDLAYVTAMRRGDLLSLKLSDLTDSGIRNNTNKDSKKILIKWTAELRQIINYAVENQANKSSEFLFCTRKGTMYTDKGIRSMWQRLIIKALRTNAISKRFTFHDIRRKAATDAENKNGREYARRLLGHTTQKMTEKYISGELRVSPLSLKDSGK